MKKILAATTALAFVGGAAFAEPSSIAGGGLTIGGEARFGLEYNSEPGTVMDVLTLDGVEYYGVDHGNPNPSTTFHQRISLNFAGSGTTDGGLTFGAESVFHSGGSGIDEGKVYLIAGGATLSFGGNDTADTLAGGITDVGIKGIGVDDVAEKGYRDTTADDVLYKHAFGALTLAASAGPAGDSNEYAVGASFTSAGMTVGVGWDSNETTSLGLKYTIDAITANAYMARRSGGDGMGADVSYKLDATTVKAVFARNSSGADAGGVGLEHDLGGGATVVGGFGQVADNVSKAELGMTFAF